MKETMSSAKVITMVYLDIPGDTFLSDGLSMILVPR